MDEVVCNVNTKICLFTYLLLLLLLFFPPFLLCNLGIFLKGKTELSWCEKQWQYEVWSRLEAVGPWEFPSGSALPFLQA